MYRPARQNVSRDWQGARAAHHHRLPDSIGWRLAGIPITKAGRAGGYEHIAPKGRYCLQVAEPGSAGHSSAMSRAIDFLHLDTQLRFDTATVHFINSCAIGSE